MSKHGYVVEKVWGSPLGLYVTLRQGNARVGHWMTILLRWEVVFAPEGKAWRWAERYVRNPDVPPWDVDQPLPGSADWT